MTKRYREPLEEAVVEGGAPASFRWRGRSYRVTRILGHWREEAGWWHRADDRSVRIQQADRWRVEATDGLPAGGVYEVVRQGGTWRLERIWD